MTVESLTKLQSLLQAYAARERPASPTRDEGERERRVCGDVLRTVVRPVLEAVMAELQRAGHEASTRDHSDRENAYPSVALSLTPRAAPPERAEIAHASGLIFRCDPKLGIVVHADVKASPIRRRAVTGGERLGTIGADVVSTAWVETKTLNFVDAVLKAN
jgi:hypothetical protein